MGYDPPTGKELAACKVFARLLREVDKIDTALHIARPDSVCFSINVGHSREGVRTNGWERLTTIPDALNDLREYKSRMAAAVVAYQKCDKQVAALLVKAESALADFAVCSKCRGEKGREVKVDKGSWRTRWEDCDGCDGRGIVPKNQAGAV